MRNLIAATALLGALALGGAAQAQQAACTVYEHINFGGAAITLENGRSFPRLGDVGFNDRISAVQVAPGCQLRVTEDNDFRGRSQVLSQSLSYVGDAANDRISAVSCGCFGAGYGNTGYYPPYDDHAAAPPLACSVYEHSDFGGEVRNLAAGEVREQLPRFNDRISSVRVAPGCSLELGEDNGFGGRREVVQRDLPYVGDYWNDRASALSCQCGGSSSSYGQYGGGSTYIGDGFGQTPYGTGGANRDQPLRRGGLACRIYNGQSFQGRAVTLRDGENVALFQDRFQGKASSMQIAPGCAVVLDIGEPYKIWIDKDDVSFRGGLNNTAIGAACYCPG